MGLSIPPNLLENGNFEHSSDATYGSEERAFERSANNGGVVCPGGGFRGGDYRVHQQRVPGDGPQRRGWGAGYGRLGYPAGRAAADRSYRERGGVFHDHGEGAGG